MPKIFIVILSFNVKDSLIECLTSVEKLSRNSYEPKVVVIDNNSRDGSVSTLKRKFPGTKIITNPENLGYAGGNNVGINYSLENGADYILILNPDVVVEKHMIEELLVVANGKSEIGIVSPKIYFSPGSEYHYDRYAKADLGRVIWWAGGVLDWNNVTTIHRGVDQVDQHNYDAPEQTQTIPGTAMFLKRAVLEKVGQFDEKYFLYFEESDLCQRAKKAGFQLWYAPQAVAWHQNAQSAGIGSSLQDYYTTRNQLLFGLRYAPIRSKFALLRQALTFLISGRPWQKRGVSDFLLGRFGKGSFPI